MTDASERRIFTLDEAADYLRLSTRTLRKEVSTGGLAVIRAGRLLRFDRTDLDSYLDRRRVGEHTDLPEAQP